MGGKVFNGIRLDKEDYNNLVELVESVIIGGRVVETYRDKSSFGDLDILIREGSLYVFPEHVKQLLNSLNIGEVVGISTNGNVTSYGMQLSQGLFQLDFISVPDESFDFAFNYHGRGDLGNFLGRVARSRGLKLGDTGLYYTQRASDNPSIILEEHLLLDKWEDVLEHLGYDAERFNRGFETLQEVFAYVISSESFDFDYFDLEKRNNKARQKVSKRPTHLAFLKYCEKNKDFIPFSRLYARFPSVVNQCLKNEVDYLLQKEYKLKFNGNIVREVLNIEGNLLGEFLALCETIFTRELVLSKSQEEIAELIREVYVEWEIY